MARRRFELVEAPIFANTLCLGERRWAPVGEGEVRSYSPLPPAALVWIHDGNGGMVYGWPTTSSSAMALTATPPAGARVTMRVGTAP